MGSSTGGVSNSALQAQLAGIDERLRGIEQDITEIKKGIMDSDLRVRAVEQDQAGMHPVLNARLEAVEKQAAKHDTQIAELTKNVAQLQHTVKVVTWICGIAAGGVISWLVASLLALI